MASSDDKLPKCPVGEEESECNLSQEEKPKSDSDIFPTLNLAETGVHIPATKIPPKAGSSEDDDGTKGDPGKNSLTHDTNSNQSTIENLFSERLAELTLKDETDDLSDQSDECALKRLVTNIKANKFKNIISLVGAGISTAAGIPDFRTPGTGLYDNLQKFNLPYSQAIFDISYFEQRPEPFYQLARDLFPGNFQPTKSHYFIKLLERKGILLRHYTQNIDNLERIAGVSASKLVEAHGTFYNSHCTGCRKEFSFEWLKDEMNKVKVPSCNSCGKPVKPDIVFFGESLPVEFFAKAKTDFKKCDLLIVMGSSLSVQPFASLVTRVNQDCPRLIINNVQVGEDMGIIYHGKRRDIFMEGDCDSNVEKLMSLLGWTDELHSIMNTAD